MSLKVLYFQLCHPSHRKTKGVQKPLNVEIERKFLVFPNEDFPKASKTFYLYQTYLTTGETEVRLRISADYYSRDKEYFLDIKTGKGMTRGERKIPISGNTFWDVVKGDSNSFISKIRDRFSDGKYFIDVDSYLNKELLGLFVAEVEFETEEEAINYVLPEWIRDGAIDVTNDETYKNAKLWESINKP